MARGSVAAPSAHVPSQVVEQSTHQPPQVQRGISKCRALYDYQSSDANELSFKQGEIITVLQKDPSGWWQGELDGRIGVFPSVEWVEEISGSGPGPVSGGTTKALQKCREHSKALYDYVADADGEISIRAGEVITVEGEEEGWLWGKNSAGLQGRYPSNYVEML